MDEYECECSLCGGPAGVLGQLGSLLWFACRDCGMQFSVKTQAEDHVVHEETP